MCEFCQLLQIAFLCCAGARHVAVHVRLLPRPAAAAPAAAGGPAAGRADGGRGGGADVRAAGARVTVPLHRGTAASATRLPGRPLLKCVPLQRGLSVRHAIGARTPWLVGCVVQNSSTRRARPPTLQGPFFVVASVCRGVIDGSLRLLGIGLPLFCALKELVAQ